MALPKSADAKFYNPDFWDPMSNGFEQPSPQALARAKRDIKDIYEQPPPGVFIVPEEDNVTKIHALVIGPLGTPYEGGFFHFFFKCPTDYPIAPPRVRLLTTDSGRVRFNPNLYACGKVCLSILGTWSGPEWSAAQGLGSVLVSIQSLMNNKPYHNEPGFRKERRPGDAARYNAIIQHETVRVAVCDTVESCFLEDCILPPALREKVLENFSDYYDCYQNNMRSQRQLHGTVMADPFYEPRGTFQHEKLLTRLENLKKRLLERNKVASGPGEDWWMLDFEAHVHNEPYQ